MTLQDIEIPDELTPAEQRAAAAEAAVSAAIGAVAEADAGLEVARSADAAGSSAATRSTLAKARRNRTAAGDQLIAAEETFERELARLDDGEERAAVFVRRQEQAELDELRRRIRAAVQSAASASGLFATLSTVSSHAGLPQVGATTLAALADFATAARVLTGRLDSEGWPKPDNNRGGSR